ncbi:MAG TPA: ABC transporter substrate-binding protein [Candidatus Limnocylindria bacterium]|jgi:alpha-glucoside transport system substrate-binding protein|nr:ABC transporter substrate-binding protein [Candidatus Limnocylindria bacterium]
MSLRFPRKFSALPIAVVVALVTACAGPGAQAPGTGAAGSTIKVMSLWGGSEQDAFQKVLDAFKTKTGVTASYESVRTDYSTTLQARISGGNPPDVAIIPGIGFLRQFARQGSLKKISDLGIDVNSLKSNYPPGILEIGQVDGTQYGIMVKFNSKSTFWYRPDKFKTLGVQTAADWNGFTKLLGDIKAKGQAPLGLGAGDSWTLTDWFESVYVRQAGPDKYDQLFGGKLPWTDSSVTAAVDTMKQALKDDYVVGGITAALGRSFTDGIGQAFAANGQAVMYYEGGFVGGIATGQTNTALKVGETIDWFDFPAINNNKSVTIGGDVIAAFTTKPGVKEFLQYMTTSEAGSVWAGTGAIISPVKAVPASAYPNDLAKREAAQVANASAVRFDGSDLLPGSGGGDMGAALQDALRGKTVDWAKFESSIQAAWKAEK